MGKRLVVAVCFIMIALFIGIFSFFYLFNSAEEIYSFIDEMNSDISSGNSPDISDLLSFWDKNKELFAIFLKHADADALDRYMLIAENCVKNNDIEKLVLTLRELEAYVKVTIDGEKPITENIF